MSATDFISRKDRMRHSAPVRFVADENSVYEGMMWDQSEGGFSAFIKIFDHGVAKATIFNEVLDLDSIAKDFLNKVFTVNYTEGAAATGEPRECKVLRCERSWERDYELFLGCRYLDEQKRSEVPSHLEKEMAGLSFDDERDQKQIETLEASDPDVITLTFPARHFYVKYVRDMAEQLASLAGFSELDVFQIKLSTDEVFTNAFKHGSPRYSDSRIRVSFIVDGGTFFVRVRDEGGCDISRSAIMRNIEKNPGQKSGMAIVDSFMDGWAIETKKGESTVVSFYKCKDHKK